ncbi:MAG: hypothetical protein S0880_00340 [Actinomycetota bacterium]|nr:hypothetical protein [Actinomycetota bacterium]
MSELEQQLRDEITEQKNDYEPGEDLLARIEADGHRRLRRSDLARRATTGLAAAAAVITVVFGVTRLLADDEPDVVDVAAEGSSDADVAPPVGSDGDPDVSYILGEPDELGELPAEPVLLTGHDLQPRLLRIDGFTVLRLSPPPPEAAPAGAQHRVRHNGEFVSSGSLGGRSGFGVADDQGRFVLDGYIVELVDRNGEVIESVELPRLTIGDAETAEDADESDADEHLVLAREAVAAVQMHAARVVDEEQEPGNEATEPTPDYGAAARLFEQRLGPLDAEVARDLRSRVPLVEHTPLTEYGVGPLRAGMTLAEAEDASGRDITVDGFGELGTACWYGRVPGQPDLLLQFEPPGAAEPGFSGSVDDPADGIISRISLIELGERVTADGVRVGDAEAEAYAAYDEDLRTTGHRYLPDGHYLFHEPDTAPEHGISYFTDGETVEEIHVGLRHAIAYVEGCG